MQLVSEEWVMVVKERRGRTHVFVARDTKQKNGERPIEWKIPRGGDLREVARDATEQAIVNYSEALKKLKKH
jgi:hypothetical protein